MRSKQELLAENALLRQQLIVAARRVKKPQFRPSERMLLVALPAMFAHWRQSLVLIQPETLLRWPETSSAACGHDGKFGESFDDVARGAGIRIIRTPKLAPKANAHCERAIGSVSRECLDHILILNQRHLQLVLDEYRGYFNTSRPHQGIDQRRPSSFDKPALGRKPPAGARVVAQPVLGGLHHTYKSAA